MPTAYLELLPESAQLPDASTGNQAPALTRRKGTEAAPTKHFLTLDFDGSATIEHAWWRFILPNDYVSGGTLVIYWMANSAAGDVKWQARVGAVTPADADTPLEHAVAAAATVTTTVNTTEARRLVSSSITLTMDSAAAGDVIFLVLLRDPTDAADTCTVDAEVLGCLFSYTT